MSEPEKKVELDLMWEGVETFYFAYGNGWTYVQKLSGWHPGVEQTVLLDFRGRSVRCYYDRREMLEASAAALPNFLNQEWVERFLSYTEKLLSVSMSFIREAHATSSGISREVLVDRIRRGTDVMYETLVAFHVTQPQYTWGIEPHLLELLPPLPVEKKQELIALLAQSAEPTLLTEEEDAWSALLTHLKTTHDSLPDDSNAEVAQALDTHAQMYGLVYAADAEGAADRSSLYERLTKDWMDGAPAKDREAERAALAKEKQNAIDEYGISEEAIRLCDTLARMSHSRLETRLRGWMPLEKILANELIPELSRFLPYTPEQLESCTPTELYGLIDGANTPSATELDERRKHVVVGIFKGEEVLWKGEEADRKLKPLLPVIDYSAKELFGQTAMKGKATGPCYVVNWDDASSISRLENMPQGAVLVAGQTRPQLMEAIRKAGAIVTDEGGLLSHAAIVSREFRIPCIINTRYATKILKDDDLVEVDADAGVVRKIG